VTATTLEALPIISFLSSLPLFYFASFFIGRRFNKHFNDIPNYDFHSVLPGLYFRGVSTHSIKTYIYIKAIALGNEKKVFKKSTLNYTNRDFKQYAKKWEVIYCQFLFVYHGITIIMITCTAIIYFFQTHQYLFNII